MDALEKQLHQIESRLLQRETLPESEVDRLERDYELILSEYISCILRECGLIEEDAT